MQRLGDILVARGAITRSDLERILPKLTGRIGASLRAHTCIRSRALAQAIAEQQQLTYVALSDAPPAPGLYIPRDLSHYLKHYYLPYRKLPDRLQIVTPEPSLELQLLLAAFYHMPVEVLVISTRDFTAAISLQAASTLTRLATHALRRTSKSLVADRVMLRHQRNGLLLLIAFSCALLVVAPSTVAWCSIALANLFYFTTLLFKLQLFVHGNAERTAIEQTIPALDTLAESITDWPTYTILVPLYQESIMVLSRLIYHLDALDYPREKLDIKLICEADDVATITSLKQCKPPETMEILTVAPSYPRTKPKACNVALPQIRGEFLVIFDAEDAPKQNQLKRAVAMFQTNPHIACLQAPLNYYNLRENMLTRLFAIEYSALFRITLPAMQRLNLPIPLSGTSNHIRVEVLKKVGGWDAFNVTEDADLGIRLAWFGYRTQLLPSLTLEESPITLRAWLKQRSRWVKGYIQTWLVYMREPAELKRRLGTRGYYGFQFFVGAPALTFLIAPFFWAAFLADRSGLVNLHLPEPLVWLCALSFSGGILVQLLYAIRAIRIQNWRDMHLAMLIYPFYWLLHSIASFRALWQLAFSPHTWAKTRHGISQVFK